MCGIFAIVFDKEREDMGQILIEAAKKLMYRGYDSVGAATISSSGEIDLRKDKGKVEEVASRLGFAQMKGIRGVTQLRWATFGEPDEVNAQPHFASEKDIVGAHNGNIVNCIQLRKKFIEQGKTVRSTNDGEMVIQAIESHFRKENDMGKAIISAAKDLKGDYAFAITRNSENKFYTAKMGSSLFMGVGEGFICCSSDLPSILPLTRNIVYLKDGEFVEFDHSNFVIKDIKTGDVIERDVEESEVSIESAEKGGFDHFMLKEIHEQPEKSRAMLGLLKQSPYLDKFCNELKNASQIFLVGCGTSYNSCLVGAYYFNKIANTPVYPLLASEFIELYGNAVDEKTVIVCVSQSGETKDVINIVNYCEKIGKGVVLGVLNTLGSSLAHRSKVYLPLACDPEISVPATKTFINQLVLMFYVAVNLAEKKGLDIDNYYGLADKIPELIEETMKTTNEKCKEVAKTLVNRKDLYYLGYGINFGIAMEGALKIKEVSYIHCEGMYSAEFKHGPLSIIEKDYPVVFATNPDEAHMVISHMNEISCRDGKVITVSQKNDDLANYSSEYVTVPDSHYFLSPIINVVPLQLIAYYTSIDKGIDPDFPRNLSKTLTVD